MARVNVHGVCAIKVIPFFVNEQNEYILILPKSSGQHDAASKGGYQDLTAFGGRCKNTELTVLGKSGVKQKTPKFPIKVEGVNIGIYESQNICGSTIKECLNREITEESAETITVNDLKIIEDKYITFIISFNPYKLIYTRIYFARYMGDYTTLQQRFDENRAAYQEKLIKAEKIDRMAKERKLTITQAKIVEENRQNLRIYYDHTEMSSIHFISLPQLEELIINGILNPSEPIYEFLPQQYSENYNSPQRRKASEENEMKSDVPLRGIKWVTNAEQLDRTLSLGILDHFNTADPAYVVSEIEKIIRDGLIAKELSL